MFCTNKLSLHATTEETGIKQGKDPFSSVDWGDEWYRSILTIHYRQNVCNYYAFLDIYLYLFHIENNKVRKSFVTPLLDINIFLKCLLNTQNPENKYHNLSLRIWANVKSFAFVIWSIILWYTKRHKGELCLLW